MPKSRVRRQASTASANADHPRRWFLPAALALIILNLAVYGPVAGHPFIAFDDPQYVAANSHVNTGLSAGNVLWAFQGGHEGNWHPLTWMSHMLDVELFGLDAGRHHVMNLAIHAAGTLLLLWLIAIWGGGVWRSTLIAALFAIHPLHVESVAWIAERKDVLSGAFWTLTLIAYTAWVRRPSGGRYLLLLASFAAGLMSKPMVVTLPCVLLLLDVWPLKRLGSLGDVAAWRRLVIEKLPLFAMTAASSVITFVAQRESGAVRALEALPVPTRLANGAVSYVEYVVQVFWPHDLAVLYPFPATIPLWQVLGAAAILLAITVLAVGQHARRPWLAVGWLWFAGTLVPVSGIVQVGSQPMADRFTYIPYTGLFIAIVWTVSEWLAAHRRFRTTAAAAGVVAVLLFAWLARQQVSYWSDTITLWTRTLAVTENNYRAHSALGYAFATAGRQEEAAAQYNAALRIHPNYPEALSNLGALRSEQGDLATAAAHLAAAVAINPSYVEARTNLGLVRARQGRVDEGLRHLQVARDLEPDSPIVRNGLGFALGRAGRLDEARREIEAALRLAPDYAEAHSNLGLILGDLGDSEAALRSFQRALALDPDNPRTHFGLGSVLADLGRPDEAVAALTEAVRLDPGNAPAQNRLGRVRMAQGRLDDAIAAFDAAVKAEPSEPDYHYDLGVMLLKTNRPAEARAHFEAALRLDANHAETRQLLQSLQGGGS